MKQCPKCQTSHSKTGVFCSRHCANSRVKTPEICEKVSKKLKGRKVGAALTASLRGARLRALSQESRVCKKCKTPYVCHKKSTRVLCSIRCSGGYREKSGRGKSGRYKGIFCNSTYELAWVVYNFDQGLTVKRFPGYITNGKIKYYPDFIEGNTIIEIKGYHTPEVDEKAQLAKDKGYEIKILYKQDLQHCFDWIKHKYNTNKIETLYE